MWSVSIFLPSRTSELEVELCYLMIKGHLAALQSWVKEENILERM